MEEYIENLLKNVKGIPILNNSLPDNYPCVTFHLYSESGKLFGSGEAEETGASCQVDIWYKVKNDAVKEKITTIKKLLIDEKYFSYPIMETSFEQGTKSAQSAKIWHTFFNFELIETEG